MGPSLGSSGIEAPGPSIVRAGRGFLQPSSLFFVSFEVYLFEKERDRESTCDWGRGRDRGERVPSRLHAVGTEPGGGLDPPNHETMT